MGGFAIDTRHLQPNFVPGSPDFQTLSPEALILLARCKPDLVPDISEEEILDKSKADGLKKFLICIQATWFIVSTIFRVATGYPITLLEFNTFAHALCALLTYAIWWSKPLDVNGPTLIDGRRCEDMVAFFAMCSHYRGHRELDLLRYAPDASSRARVRFFPRQPHGAEPSEVPTSAPVDIGHIDEEVYTRLRVPDHDPQNPDRPSEIPHSYCALQMEQTLFGFRFELARKFHHAQQDFLGFSFKVFRESVTSDSRQSLYSVKPRPYILLTSGDVLRWHRASEAVASFLVHQEATGSHSFVNFLADGAGDSNNKLDPDLVPDLLVNRSHNWKTNMSNPSFFRSKDADVPVLIAFTVANLFYGGLHLVPYFLKETFHSLAEQLLWLISAAMLCYVGALSCSFIIIRFVHVYLLKFLRKGLSRAGAEPSGERPSSSSAGENEGPLRSKRTRLNLLPFVGVVIGTIVGYGWWVMFARVFLIVECFLDLFRLDPRVFDVPTWVNYFPHIG